METIYRNEHCVGVIRSTAFGYTIDETVVYGYVDIEALNTALKAEGKDTIKKLTNKWLGNMEGGVQWYVGNKGDKLNAKLHLNAPFDPSNNRVKGIYEEEQIEKLEIGI